MTRVSSLAPEYSQRRNSLPRHSLLEFEVLFTAEAQRTQRWRRVIEVAPSTSCGHSAVFLCTWEVLAGLWTQFSELNL